MALPRIEQETITREDPVTKILTVYTSEPARMKKLSASPLYHMIRADKQNGEVIAMEFTADRRYHTLRLKDRKKMA